MAQEKVTLIYVGDPMCSWCYGFSPEFHEVTEQLHDAVELKVVMGGLRPFNKQPMLELKSFLTEHWQEVHEASGQEFSYDILNEPAMAYDTEPACRAVVTMRKLNPELEWTFFKDIQTAFYYGNKNPNLSATYADIAKKYGIDRQTFMNLFESSEIKEAVQNDFQYAKELEARGFPTVIVKKGESYYLVARGYMKKEALLKNIQKVLD